MLLRSGCSGGGGGLGSCLFVPEGPAIFITSRIQFPAPASLGLFRGRMRSILTRPLSFLRIRAVITENAPRCDCNPALRAAVYILHFYQCDLQISCIPQEICTSNTEEHILSSFGGRVTFFSFLFFFLNNSQEDAKKIFHEISHQNWQTGDWGRAFGWNRHSCPTMSGNFIVGERSRSSKLGRKPKWKRGDLGNTNTNIVSPNTTAPSSLIKKHRTSPPTPQQQTEGSNVCVCVCQLWFVM